MRNVTANLLLVAIPILLIGGALLSMQKSGVNEDDMQSTYENVVIRYLINIGNESDQLVNNAKVEIFAPIELRDIQKIVSINSNPEFSQTDSNNRPNNLFYEFDTFPPFSQRQVVITANIQLVIEPVKTELKNAEFYLADGYFLSMRDQRVEAVIQQMHTKEKKTIPQKTYDWVNANLKYAGYMKEDRGALYAITQQKGDCTEYMYVLMALLRGNNIPARGMAGFYLKKNNQVVKAEQYHNWVEYYDGDSWRILDPLNNNFDKGYERYVRLREIPIEPNNTGMTSQRFISHDVRLHVSMN